MSNLSISSIINKNALSSDVPWLVAVKAEIVNPDTLAIVETIRFVKNNEDVTIDGDTYVASAFSLSIDEGQEELPTVSLTVVDITQTIQSRMQEYKGGNGSHVTIYIFPATSTTIVKPEIEYKLDIVSASASASDYSVTWTLGAENPLTLPVPSRVQLRDRCSWRYKGENCGYSGAITSCDLSLEGENGCSAHDNQERFGGYPGISVRGI
jgi:hypothetical protein